MLLESVLIREEHLALVGEVAEEGAFGETGAFGDVGDGGLLETTLDVELQSGRLKPTASVPHVGGQVMVPGEPYYEILRAWISDGAVLKSETPRVAKIELSPSNPIVQQVGLKLGTDTRTPPSDEAGMAAAEMLASMVGSRLNQRETAAASRMSHSARPRGRSGADAASWWSIE